MMKNLRGSLMLLIAAIIWGTTFVAQSEGTRYVEPFTYNSLRMFIGGIVLIPVIALFNKSGKNSYLPSDNKKTRLITTVKGGICCGFILFIAASLQQIAIGYTTAGKAGFITALYIVIVPLIELILLRKRIQKKIWICVLLAIIGFYMLCITDDFGIARGDFLTLICALVFAFHIIAVDYFNGKDIDGVLMACIQFFTSGAFSLLAMLIFENPQIGSIIDAKITILYAGILSCGVAYTLQILGQRYTEPTLATLLMSLESVFAALSGWLILKEQLTLKEGIGCILVFTAVILAQLKTPQTRQEL